MTNNQHLIYALTRNGHTLIVGASPDACYQQYKSMYDVQSITELSEVTHYKVNPFRTGKMWSFDADITQRVTQKLHDSLQIWEWKVMGDES